MVSVLVILAVAGTGGAAVAVPPPPPHPSDAELERSRRTADARADEVGRLANDLAEARSRLRALRDEVALRMEEANKALVDLRAAEDAAAQAERDAEAAGAEVDVAAENLRHARADLDRFVEGSFQQGSTIGSIGAYLGSENPKDLLARAQLLGAISGSRLDALDEMQRSRIEKSNKDAQARQALKLARQRRDDAARARDTAEDAQQVAIAVQRDHAARTRELESELHRREQQLHEMQSHVQGLEGQRQRYEDWQERTQREEERDARAAVLAAEPDPAPADETEPAKATVEAVVDRAMSQLGVPYAWGGGTASGPSYGIRDGGVADSHGDYRKVGFDCSGLMIYAFAGVRDLPHYSGYQYEAGRQVPLSQMRRGDMLFWGPDGIHHVALYLGDGQMIEAPYSGAHVRIAPVRYDGIMPYATRLIG